jgi:hypothetical protein
MQINHRGGDIVDEQVGRLTEKCEKLEDRLNKLENWVFDHCQALSCTHRNGPICKAIDGMRCHEQECPYFPEDVI